MGIIKKQTIKGTIINYIGVIIGFVTAAILSPMIDSETIGLVSVIVAYSIIISNIGGLGIAGITTKLFPYFRTKDNKHNGFLFVAISIASVGFILATIIVIILKQIAYFDRNSDDLFMQHFYYIIPVVFFQIFFSLFDNYYKIIFDAIKGIYLRELVQKLGTFIAIAMMVAGFFDFETFIIVYLIGFSLPGLIFIFYAIFDRKTNFKPNLDFIDKELKSSIISVGLFSIISGASGIIAVNIDKIMLESMTSLSDTGVYSIAFYFGLIISIPARSLVKISSALIAESWKNNDLKNISTIYKKSTINLFVVGVLFLIGLVINIDNILVFLSNEYANGKIVIILIAFAFLSDMLGGTAPQILASSDKYKIQTYLMIIFVLLVILTNYILIPLYGINGAAIATLISKLIVNTIRYIIVYKNYKFQPYNYKFLLVIVIGALMLGISYIIPKQTNFIVDIIVRSSVISIFYLGLIYILNISEDINNQFNSIIRKIKR